jgi:hypothetical protein
MMLYAFPARSFRLGPAATGHRIAHFKQKEARRNREMSLPTIEKVGG